MDSNHCAGKEDIKYEVTEKGYHKVGLSDDEFVIFREWEDARFFVKGNYLNSKV